MIEEKVNNSRKAQNCRHLAEHLDVLLLLLQFHVVVGLRQLVDEDHHVLVLPNLLHHELADFIICDFDGVHLGVLGQSLEQVPLKF